MTFVMYANILRSLERTEKKRRSHGADGQDLIVKVPEGTIIRDDASGKIIADMSGKNMREVILKGGRGGAGNMHFATPTMQVPKFAKPGTAGRWSFGFA